MFDHLEVEGEEQRISEKRDDRATEPKPSWSVEQMKPHVRPDRPPGTAD